MASGVVKACIVFMCSTSDQGKFTMGAIRVLKTSILLNGSRSGE